MTMTMMRTMLMTTVTDIILVMVIIATVLPSNSGHYRTILIATVYSTALPLGGPEERAVQGGAVPKAAWAT